MSSLVAEEVRGISFHPGKESRHVSSASMTNIKLAGVPEQAFIPIHLAAQEGIFNRLGIELEWHDTPEGTGKLLTLVEDGHVTWL